MNKSRTGNSLLFFVLGSNEISKPSYQELGTIPNETFFYFTDQDFETTDEEILEWISKNDPSHSFLHDKEEDIYTLDDGYPV
ncbi:MAG: hypothetical protein HYS08_02175 [Chlamydiae bacterium]|nr:hypothetical protein [Chlamydiota bacterium]MBI3266682.1 hypothetical protein [Chlamydiota bacterium]